MSRLLLLLSVRDRRGEETNTSLKASPRVPLDNIDPLVSLFLPERSVSV